MSNKRMVLAILFSALMAEPALARSFDVPRYVGPAAASRTLMCNKDAPLSFMTAEEMQATVIGLTGFFHPSFNTYADVLGRIDPSTGKRTTDRPSLVGSLLMQQIAGSVGACAVDREIFLPIEERVVFHDTDLSASPDDGSLDHLIASIHEKWVGRAPGPRAATLLHDQFRSVEAANGATAAYKRLLSLMLQHGAIYFY